ncbi:glycoside hydrolase family 43 protein [Solwaraspora sp. WMMA2080]|uniref:glycoside hydrolase family 43 protein n=1 Tax=unclassified Solwaraspora TaxID=2627926 RepID=UPI00248AA730|nr:MULTISPECIES: glycoside hydrolase family 43 protein [unclassified Solwaraspora]WBB99348.1 glycoside hydrolase family 43 protein [Solwaraspora sp. WMMA2059]WBC22102.1 glycoside hydrolase family 43 protein [Solwaraspora sp. WMMA2080]
MPRILARLSAVLAAACLLFTSWSMTAARPAAALDPFTGYLMAHFTGETANGEQIHLAHSTDGLHWTDLNNGSPVLLSTVGTRGVRDPVLVRSPAGDRYWIIATDLRIASGTSWNDAANRGSTSIVVWESTDLVNWSAPWLLNVAGGIAGAGNAWAPEAIYNPATGDYVVYWATNSARNGITKHRIWYARTSDFRTIGAPQLYIDRGSGQGIIDTQIIEVPNSVGGYRYYRASADGHITIEASNSILGNWTTLGNLSHLGISNGTGGGNVVEGPMWAQFNGRDEWVLWLDQYATGRGYLPVTSTNLGSTGNFRTRSDYSMGGSRKRHGSILNLTAAEQSRVLARWGATTPVNRIQSYNYPDRYVRHADFDVRIDANVSPAQDAQFRLVPGLTGGSGYVSIESVNYPGHYLRHYAYDFELAPDDGSAIFAADATFRRVAGLADAGWSSFQSYNFPDRYIRHYGYQLRLDPITAAQARADATFRVTG